MPPMVRITSPLPSIEETAARAGVPAARTQELVALAERLTDRRMSQKAFRAIAKKAAAKKRSSQNAKKSAAKKNAAPKLTR
jgi:hypothetical protein